MRIYIIVCVFIVLDIITGIIKASYNGNIDSAVLRKGLYNKLTEILAICLVTFVEYALKYVNLNINIPLTSVTVAYIIVMEVISSIENVCAVNTTLADFFQPYLAKIRGDKNSENNKGN